MIQYSYMAVTYNITIDQGADYFLDLIYQDPSRIPVNLTGYTSALQLRSTPSSPTSVLSLTSTDGIVITPDTGGIAIHATAAKTGAVVAGNYAYDLEKTSSGGVVTRLIQGTASMNAQVTIV